MRPRLEKRFVNIKRERLRGHCHCCCSGWKVSGFFASLHADLRRCSGQQFRVSVWLTTGVPVPAPVCGHVGAESVLKVFSEFQEGDREPEEGGSSRSEEFGSGVGLAGFLSLAPALLAKAQFPHLESGVTVHFLRLL